MILQTKEKTIELIYKTRLVQQFEERMKVENSQSFWFKAAQDANLKILATALTMFSGNAFKVLDDAYDFIDAYLEENSDASIFSMYEGIITDINTKGFFGNKLQPENLAEMLRIPFIDQGELMRTAAKNLTEQMMAEHIRK